PSDAWCGRRRRAYNPPAAAGREAEMSLSDKTSAPRLDSWKEIAQFLNRDVRTVRRWGKSEGLPVPRHLHQAKSSVYAFRSELETWRAARIPVTARRRWARMWRATALSMTAVLLMASYRSGPTANAASEGRGVSLTQVMTRFDGGFVDVE